MPPGGSKNGSDLGGAMSLAEQNTWAALSPLISGEPAQASWYAIQTWPKHERKIYVSLVKDGVEALLPLTRNVRRWSDRRMVLEIPLFPCYVFLRIVPLPVNRIPVLRIPGVVSFVGMRGRGVRLLDSEIENLRRLTDHAGVDAHPFLVVGHRVRIRGGCLEGVEGILVEKEADRKLVVSVSAIQKSIAISLNGYDVEPA